MDNPYSPVDSYYEDIFFSTKDVNGKWTAPVPLPTPVATNDVPAVLLAAPIAVKDVLPAVRMTYLVPTTKEPALTVDEVVYVMPLFAVVSSIMTTDDSIVRRICILPVKPVKLNGSIVLASLGSGYSTVMMRLNVEPCSQVML